MNRISSSTVVTGARRTAVSWPVLAVAAVLILAALGAYWNSFHVPFLMDDRLSIGENPSIRHLGRIGDVLSPSPPAQTIARPLVNLSLALNYAGGGTSVRGYHVVNLLIHICAGLALLGLVRRTLLLPALCQRYGEAALPLAACVALIWTLHPLQTEAVTYISQRAESLMGLFYLLTLYGFIRADAGRGRRTPPGELNPDAAGFGDPALQQSAIGGSNWWLGLSVFACLCGMATKQVMVTAPVLVLLFDRAFVSGSFRSALANRRWYYIGLAASWAWLGFLMGRSSLAVIGVGFQEHVSWVTYGLTELRVVTGYLKLAFWPHPLVFDYGTEILATYPLAPAPYALIVIVILAGVVMAWRRSPMAGFLGAWFFLILAPTSTVVPIWEQPMAESRMYLSLAGVVVFVTLLSYAFGRRSALVALGLVAVGLGALTVRRNHVYRSELSIWDDTVARHPQTSRGHYNLGIAFSKLPDRLPDAIAQYEEALRLKPAASEVHNNLGLELAKMPGRLPDAIAQYEEALRLNSAAPEVHNNLGIALAKMPGRLPEAIVHFEEALRINPEFVEAQNNLAYALTGMPGRLADAIAHFEAALRLKPDFAEAQTNLADALMDVPGRMPDAIAHYEEAVRLKPEYVEAHYNFAVALAKMPGRMPDAIAHFETAVRLRPGFVEARCNLAAIYAAIGRWEAAIDQLEIAARLDPASAAIRDNLEKLKARRKQ